MPIEKETIVERPVEHETVVADSGGGGLGAIAGIVAAAVVVLFAIWLFSGGLNNNKSVSVDLPKVTVSP